MISQASRKPEWADTPELVLRKENKLTSVGGFFDLKPRCYDEKTIERDLIINLYKDKISFSKNLILQRREQHRLAPLIEFSIKDLLQFECIDSTPSTDAYFLIEISRQSGSSVHFFKNPYTEAETNDLKDKVLELSPDGSALNKNTKELSQNQIVVQFAVGFLFLSLLFIFLYFG